MNFPEAPRCLSRPRLSRYISAAGANVDAALQLYVHNAEVSAAFWFSFSVLEITLRNRIHDALAFHFENERWWLNAVLTDRERHTIRQAEGRGAAAGGIYSVGRVVAELGFGFWVGLLSARHHSGLWVNLIELVFEPRYARRAQLHAEAQRLQRLRNRIAHHEPIFTRDLLSDHALLLTVLGHLSPEASSWVAECSRVPEVIARRGRL